MKIIRYAELKARPGRNREGSTHELARFPASAAPGSAADGTWDWRVSITDLSTAGPLSPVPGTERVLTVIDGELLLLSVDGAEHPLEKYRPFRFPGDVDSAGSLPTGNIRELSVTARTGAFKGYTSIVELSKKRAHPVFAGQLGILLQGQAEVRPGNALADGGAEQLGRYDAVVGSDTGTPEILGRGFLAVVSIDPAGD
jgi:environmental stress-induced protein Ves